MNRPDPRVHGHPARGFRPIAHCQYAAPSPWDPWPPVGWSELGLTLHQHKARMARLVLAFLAKEDEHGAQLNARAAELRQFGDSAAKASRAITDAHDAVVALTNIGTVETAEIDMRDERGKDAS